jgi:hypothetical protein
MKNDDTLYMASAVGKSLMVFHAPERPDVDLRAVLALELGVTANQVMIRKLPPGIYELNEFLKFFGIELPKMASAVPEEWEGSARFIGLPDLIAGDVSISD